MFYYILSNSHNFNFTNIVLPSLSRSRSETDLLCLATFRMCPNATICPQISQDFMVALYAQRTVHFESVLK
jgi:hypothetical protein